MRYISGILIALVVMSVYGGVNLKNGNFFISYTDVIVSGGGKSLEITRTYNSKSTEVGWFGFGWGSDFETHLRVGADGSVIIQENGGGAFTRFTPKSKLDGKAAARKVVEEVKKKTSLSARAAQKLIKKLSKDAELRYSYAKQFGVEAKIDVGVKLYSQQRGLQELIRTKNGFVRKSISGKSEFFNKNGKLSKIDYKSSYSISFSPAQRSDDKELKSIKDSVGNQIFLKWLPSGRVEEIYSSKDKKATYAYKGRSGELLNASKDLVGNTYNYDYDNNHNLTIVKYKDGTATKMTYEEKTQLISSVTKRNGEMTRYKHGADPKNPESHYWTEVTKTVASKKGTPKDKGKTNRYEYEIRAKSDGQQYTYRVVTTINGFKTETIYSKHGGKPLKIVQGKSVTSFEYDSDGLLTKKTLPNGKHIALKYHKKCKKISRVTDGKMWTKFKYGDKCNLRKASNSKKKSVVLSYDHKSRITTMVDRDERSKKQQVLKFVYNAQNKPVEIKMAKVGAISVKYDSNGVIKKIEPRQNGRRKKGGERALKEMAFKITQTFQNLLAMVKPAGVSLGAGAI